MNKKNSKIYKKVVRTALDSGVDTEAARKNLKALNEINKNLDLTISEQRALINIKNSVSESYNQILRDSFAIKGFERLNFEQDIMLRLRKMNDGLGDAVMMLLLPLTKPELKKKFSIENFYTSYGVIKESDCKNGLYIDNGDMYSEEKNKERNKIYMEICSSFFAFVNDKHSFGIKKYISSLSMDELFRWSKDGLLPNTLLSIFQKGKIDIEALKEAENIIVTEPLGELDLLWIISELPKNYLDIKRIVFTTSNEKFDFYVTDGETSARIEMTDFLVEVER